MGPLIYLGGYHLTHSQFLGCSPKCSVNRNLMELVKDSKHDFVCVPSYDRWRGWRDICHLTGGRPPEDGIRLHPFLFMSFLDEVDDDWRVALSMRSRLIEGYWRYLFRPNKNMWLGHFWGYVRGFAPKFYGFVCYSTSPFSGWVVLWGKREGRFDIPL